MHRGLEVEMNTAGVDQVVVVVGVYCNVWRGGDAIREMSVTSLCHPPQWC